MFEMIKQIKAMRKEVDQMYEIEREKIDNMTLEELKEYSKQIKEMINEVKK